jgi:hypothetical protein
MGTIFALDQGGNAKDSTKIRAKTSGARNPAPDGRTYSR